MGEGFSKLPNRWVHATGARFIAPFAANHLRGNFEKLSPILRPYGTPDFCYAFSTHITPLTGRKAGCFIVALSRRDKLLVENGLSNNPRPVRDAIWVEVIGK